jgi:hypothetical protein
MVATFANQDHIISIKRYDELLIDVNRIMVTLAILKAAKTKHEDKLEMGTLQIVTSYIS